jgi:hypothetical protein
VEPDLRAAAACAVAPWACRALAWMMIRYGYVCFFFQFYIVCVYYILYIYTHNLSIIYLFAYIYIIVGNDPLKITYEYTKEV